MSKNQENQSLQRGVAATTPLFLWLGIERKRRDPQDAADQQSTDMTGMDSKFYGYEYLK